MVQRSGTALILGASRGLGLGLAEAFLCRHWRVIATERGPSPGLAAAAGHEGFLRVETLDINDEPQADALAAKLASEKLDVLFVNAGVIDDRRPAGTATTEEFNRLLVTNALSPMRMIERFAPLVTPNGVIAVMSSGLGSVSTNTSGGSDVYRASKAALNTLLRCYAARDQARGVLAISPGWVRTDMGGAGASLDVESSARGIADVLISRIGVPGSAFLNYHGNPVPW